MSKAGEFVSLFEKEDEPVEQHPEDFDSVEDAVGWINKIRKSSGKIISKLSAQYTAANQTYTLLMTGIDDALADIKSGLVDKGVKKLEECKSQAKEMRKNY